MVAPFHIVIGIVFITIARIIPLSETMWIFKNCILFEFLVLGGCLSFSIVTENYFSLSQYSRNIPKITIEAHNTQKCNFVKRIHILQSFNKSSILAIVFMIIFVVVVVVFFLFWNRYYSFGQFLYGFFIVIAIGWRCLRYFRQFVSVRWRLTVSASVVRTSDTVFIDRFTNIMHVYEQLCASKHRTNGIGDGRP